MKNLVSRIPTETNPVERIIPRQRPLTEREFNRHVRESGLRQRALTVKVARAMKYATNEG